MPRADSDTQPDAESNSITTTYTLGSDQYTHPDGSAHRFREPCPTYGYSCPYGEWDPASDAPTDRPG
jgi:hypothetical protein